MEQDGLIFDCCSQACSIVDERRKIIGGNARQTCALPGCNEPRWVDKGKVLDYCGISHASIAKTNEQVYQATTGAQRYKNSPTFQQTIESQEIQRAARQQNANNKQNTPSPRTETSPTTAQPHTPTYTVNPTTLGQNTNNTTPTAMTDQQRYLASHHATHAANMTNARTNNTEQYQQYPTNNYSSPAAAQGDTRL
jgi:hypothetical protein